jgi:hypothetical protein
MPGPDPRKNRTRTMGPKGKKKKPILIIGGEKFNVIPGSENAYSILEKSKKGRMIDGQFYPAMAKGGRVGLKAGSKGCKLAMKGKGRAYGKNS